jgi:lipopolysaccharide export system permease protein
MILLELFKVFILSLTALTGLFLLAGLIQEASQRGLAPSQILMAIPLLIPNTLPYTIPATTLFATCVVYGRMSADNEILVMKSAGVNILRLLKPAILLGLATSAVTGYLYYEIIPSTQRIMRQKFLSDAEEVIYGILKREGALRQGNLPYVIFVKEVQGKRLLDVIFKRRVMINGEWKYDVVARTREARLKVDMTTKQIIVDMGSCVAYGDNVGADLRERQYAVPVPDNLLEDKGAKNRAGSMTYPELQQKLAEVKEAYHKAQERCDAVKARLDNPQLNAAERELVGLELKAETFNLTHALRVYKSFEVEIQMRPALAVGCLCFVLIGCPVGIWASRADYLSTFVICFLPTVFAYYPMVLAGGNMAKDGKLPVIPAVWAADAVLGTVALTLIWRLMRR